MHSFIKALPVLHSVSAKLVENNYAFSLRY